jgi:glyoxylate/hydroxypyruvate reductase
VFEVVLIAPFRRDDQAAISAVDPRIHVHDAWELFAPELIGDWPRQTAEWYLPAAFAEVPDSPARQHERDALLGIADAICLTFPFPLRLVQRAPRVRFIQQLPAGVSNLQRGDVWQSNVPVTSGRGAANSLAIAEWTLAAIFALFKQFPRALDRAAPLDRRGFQARQVAGKTLGVVGLGGIGKEVARLGRAVGMRVIGSRRSAEPVPHVERLYAPAELHDLLAGSDVVVLAAQLTDQTHGLIDTAALHAMRPGALLLNVARGELVDESAVIQALRAGHLGGFASDVYAGEFERQPPAELLDLDNVLLTPHTSSMSDQSASGARTIFRDNLRRCLAGEPLLNQVDWSRGY